MEFYMNAKYIKVIYRSFKKQLIRNIKEARYYTHKHT